MRHRAFNNSLHPAVPYLFLYDEDGNQEFNGIFLTWDTIKINTPHFNYTADQDRIYVNTNSSGLYRIHFECSLDVAGGNTRFSVYKNGTLENGSYSETFSGTIGQTGTYQHVSLDYIIYLEKDDYFQIKGENINGSNGQSTPNSSRLIVEFIPMHGWNNSAGGRVDYKGGVMR